MDAPWEAPKGDVIFTREAPLGEAGLVREEKTIFSDSVWFCSVQMIRYAMEDF